MECEEKEDEIYARLILFGSRKARWGRPAASNDEDGVKEVQHLQMNVTKRTSHLTPHTSHVTHLGQVEHPHDVGKIWVHERNRNRGFLIKLKGQADPARKVTHSSGKLVKKGCRRLQSVLGAAVCLQVDAGGVEHEPATQSDLN